MRIEPKGQQIIAVEKILKWRGKTSKFAFGGFAGTGKTSLIPVIREELAALGFYNTLVATYTNKAASVLRGKGIEDATTIFRIMYDLVDDVNMVWQKRGAIAADCVIIDEASMVSNKIREDLESYGIPILYVGDPFQLPPVGDGESSVLDHPDYTLTEIHRQAENSPIIKIATAIREGRRYDDIDQCLLKDKDLLEYEAIICLSNRRRHILNQRKRAALGKEGPAMPGDKVIMCVTDYDNGLGAGECGIILETNGKRRYTVQFEGWAHPHKFFNSHFMLPEENPYSIELKGRQCIDFGYAITCHKAQGSQYDSVLVWEERRADARWRYTAATRAVNHLQMAGY